MKLLSQTALLEISITLLIGLTLWAWVLLVPPVVIKVRRLHVRGALGLALPGLIFLTPQAWNEQVLRHELAHQQQMRRYSPLGASLLLGWHYGIGLIRWRMRTGTWPSIWNLWHDIPLEREANEAMKASAPLPRVIGWDPERR